MAYKFRKIVSIFLAILMAFSGMPVSAIAAEIEKDAPISNYSASFDLLAATGATITRLVLAPRSAVVAVNDTHSFTATLCGSTDVNVTASCVWTSDNETIATVDQNGTVTGKSIGSTQIHCTYTSGLDSWSVYAYVTVTEVEYKVTYFSDYPEDAKKYTYTNGGSANVSDAQDTSVTYSYRPNETVAVLENVFTLINYDFIGYVDQDGNSYQPGETITVSKNTTLTAQWRSNDNSTQERTIQVIYHGNDDPYRRPTSITKEVNARLKITGNTAEATFLLANVQDTIGTIKYTDWHGDPQFVHSSNDLAKHSGWEIGGQQYGANTQVTVTCTKKGN